jgi:ribosome-associated protein
MDATLLPPSDPLYKSKSQKKRESLALQDLGRDLVALKPALIRRSPLSPEIQEAILAAQNMKMGALKRQVQRIGKLLREEEDLSDLESWLTR